MLENSHGVPGKCSFLQGWGPEMYKHLETGNPPTLESLHFLLSKHLETGLHESLQVVLDDEKLREQMDIH